MLRVHGYHKYLVLALASIMTMGMALSYLYSMNHFNLLLSATRALDYASFKQMERYTPSRAADRRNWVNVYFVKLSWFWNTLCTVVVAASLSNTVTWKRLSRFALRWALATCAWFAMSQWFFGASFLERMHVASGAQCLANSVRVSDKLCRTRQRLTADSHPQLFDSFEPGFSTTHKSIHAGWHGGMDVSGHTFVLTLSILYLAELVVPCMTQRAIASMPRGPMRCLKTFSLYGTLSLMVLWAFMLFTTSIYYHTTQEKVVAFLCALAVWICLPKEPIS